MLDLPKLTMESLGKIPDYKDDICFVGIPYSTWDENGEYVPGTDCIEQLQEGICGLLGVTQSKIYLYVPPEDERVIYKFHNRKRPHIVPNLPNKQWYIVMDDVTDTGNTLLDAATNLGLLDKHLRFLVINDRVVDSEGRFLFFGLEDLLKRRKLRPYR